MNDAIFIGQRWVSKNELPYLALQKGRARGAAFWDGWMPDLTPAYAAGHDVAYGLGKATLYKKDGTHLFTWHYSGMRPTRIALALFMVMDVKLEHQMQPDVLDAALMDFVANESSEFRRTLKIAAHQMTSGQASAIYINGRLWTPPAPIKPLNDWTLRAARITLAMYRSTK